MRNVTLAILVSFYLELICLATDSGENQIFGVITFDSTLEIDGANNTKTSFSMFAASEANEMVFFFRANDAKISIHLPVVNEIADETAPIRLDNLTEFYFEPLYSISESGLRFNSNKIVVPLYPSAIRAKSINRERINPLPKTISYWHSVISDTKSISPFPITRGNSRDRKFDDIILKLKTDPNAESYAEYFELYLKEAIGMKISNLKINLNTFTISFEITGEDPILEMSIFYNFFSPL